MLLTASDNDLKYVLLRFFVLDITLQSIAYYSQILSSVILHR